MMSVIASTFGEQHLLHGNNPHAATSSQNAVQIGTILPTTTPYTRDAVMGDANRHPAIRLMPQGESRVVVNRPP